MLQPKFQSFVLKTYKAHQYITQHNSPILIKFLILSTTAHQYSFINLSTLYSDFLISIKFLMKLHSLFVISPSASSSFSISIKFWTEALLLSFLTTRLIPYHPVTWSPVAHQSVTCRLVARLPITRRSVTLLHLSLWSALSSSFHKSIHLTGGGK
jgi:sensor histidine kinase YesM